MALAEPREGGSGSHRRAGVERRRGAAAEVLSAPFRMNETEKPGDRRNEWQG